MIVVVRKMVKWFYTLFAVIAISLAIIVQAGRSLSPYLNQYTQDISHYLSEKLNAKVSIGSLKADWQGLKPMVDMRQLRILSQSNQPIIILESAQMRLDLLDSLLHARLVWSNLSLNSVQMDFVQTRDGLWQIPGIPHVIEKTPEDQAAQLDPLIDMVLLSGRIEFNKSKLKFHFASGDNTLLEAPILKLESKGDFHRLNIQIDIDRHPKTLELVIEGRGDPRKKQSFTSKGYIKFDQFPTNEPIAAATALLLRGINAEVHSEGTLNAHLWFNSRPNYQGYDLVGNIGIQRLSVPILSRKLTMDSFSMDVVGHWLYTGQWKIGLQNIVADINNIAVDKLSFEATSESASSPVQLRMPRVNVEYLTKALDASGVLGDGRLRQVMRTLNPRGELNNLQVSIPLQKPAEWLLQANLSKLANDAWQGVPALGQVDGFVQAGQKGGFVDINSEQGFSMHYYPTYTEPMRYQKAKGQVAWWLYPEQNQIYVNSGALEFVNGTEQAKGYMWLALPWKYDTGDIDLYLHIGARQLTANQYTKYTPAVVPHSLLEWLSKSIGDKNTGEVDQAGFVYRGTLNTKNRAARTHQLYVDVRNAQLNYHPEWPALTSLTGKLLVADEHVNAHVDSAKLFSSDVSNTSIKVSPTANADGSFLDVEGDVSGSASDGLRVLRESMLRKTIGASMDTWSLEGSMNTHVSIGVPLGENKQNAKATQQIDIDLIAPNFEMKNLRLNVRDIAGHISYNQDTGIASDGLVAHLFNRPVQVFLGATHKDGKSQTTVDVSGEVDGNVLARWSQRPEALFLKGVLPYDARVVLNHKHIESPNTIPFAEVAVTSPLTGVFIDLPEPYGKTRDSERPLIFNMSMYGKKSLIDIKYGDNLQGLFELNPEQGNALSNANIALNAPSQLAQQPQFLVSGKLPTIDILPWKKVQERYMSFLQEFTPTLEKPSVLIDKPEDDMLIAGLVFRANVLLDHYKVGPLTLNNIDVNAERIPAAWKVAFSNPIVNGDVYLPNDNKKPLQINLQHLHLTHEILGVSPKVNHPQPVIDAITAADTTSSYPMPIVSVPNVDPRTLPLANVMVKALYMDSVNYGHWTLQIRPNANGVVFDNIHGAVKGVTVGGLNDALSGAKMVWSLTENGSKTHFTGALSADNISSVMQQWQKPDTIESSNTRFGVDVGWDGDPEDFALKKLSGNMDIWLEKGRFKRNPSAGSDGFLRLMAILNFDSIARRLRLDFSDLYQSGLAYDTISGKVAFEPSTMTFTEPLQVITPSSRLQMAGKLDIEKETINARLVAKLPVAGNLTFLTALATGLPAAAGIYVVSKLFKKQVEQATSVSYTIRGSWGEPNMSFDRLFESEDDLIKRAEQEAPTPLKRTKKKNRS